MSAWFPWLTGGWAIVMLGIFIQAVRLSYRIEARSGKLQNTSGLPRNAMLFHTIFNISVARDAETQGMRGRMLVLLGLNVLGFLLLWVAIARMDG